ncbi:MAG: hypothetical protein AAGF12_03775 [Myxococcota bacterium]
MTQPAVTQPAMTRLAMTGLAMTRLAMKGLAMTRLAMTGLAMTGLAMTRLAITVLAGIAALSTACSVEIDRCRVPGYCTDLGPSGCDGCLQNDVCIRLADTDQGACGRSGQGCSRCPVELPVCREGACGPQNPAVAVSAGSTTTCAVDDRGGLFCWGGESTAQQTQVRSCSSCPDDTTCAECACPDNQSAPELIRGGSISTVALSTRFFGQACALREGQAVCWGQGAPHLGVGDSDSRCAPNQVQTDVRFTALATANQATYGLDDRGQLYGWGNNANGRLGELPGAIPTPMPMFPGVTFGQVDNGGSVGCGVDDGGQLMCWGGNSSGALGAGLPIESRSYATPQAVGTRFRSVSVGDGTACAIEDLRAIDPTSRLTLYCWGQNDRGQLGIGSAGPPQNAPTDPVLPERSWREVSVGEDHACALTEDDRLFCWGSNIENAFDGRVGQTGVEPERDFVETPGEVALDPPRAWRTVSAGAAHTCAVTWGGEVFCWGHNGHSQLGRSHQEGSSSAPWVVLLPPR